MANDPLADIRDLIARHWGFRGLRPMQEQAIAADLDRRDSLVVMPTGGGKSLCYQAPAAFRTDETTVVVSPLISLMKDQVDHLSAAGVSALRVDSTLSEADKLHAARELRAGRVRLLFAAPERLMTPKFQGFLDEIGVRTFAIDEAHCISHWGHDFRPEYRQMATLRDRFPNATFHAFTATATQQVRDDIVEQLRLRDPAVLVGNFDRPNLVYRCLAMDGAFEQTLEVLERHKGQAGIIYCISRREVDQLTHKLRQLGHNAMRYRAANPDESSDDNQAERKATHDAFRSGKCDLVVATVAFGMGIDRSDIRFVLHTGMPKSVEHYQQEAGRAGRDGLEAECVLIHSLRNTIMWKDMAKEAFDQQRIDADQYKHTCEQVERITAYAKGGQCRHKSLVEHFGQPFKPENCGACDVCLGEVAFEPDGTVIAQKILSCVARVQERFGMGHVSEVLRGKAGERVVSLGHDKLTTFGLLADRADKQVKAWIGQLIGDGKLAQSEGEYPVLKLNEASWRILRGEEPARLTRGAAKAASRKSVAEEVSWEGVDEALFDALRNWRREVAANKGLPPYTIFNDSTLRDVSRVRPTTRDRLHQISGVGERRLEDYGDAVLEIVARVATERGLSLDNNPAAVVPASRPRTLSSEAEEAFPHFRRGKSIAETAAFLAKTPGTVTEYLAGFIETEKPPTVDAWVDKSTQARIRAAADEHGTARLKPIFLALNQEVPYDAIRIVLAHLNARRG